MPKALSLHYCISRKACARSKGKLICKQLCVPRHNKKADDFSNEIGVLSFCWDTHWACAGICNGLVGCAVGSMTCLQERQRQGIHGIHMRSLDEHLDQQELQKLLGEVIHHTRDSMDAPAPDHKTLAKVILSRQVSYCLEVHKKSLHLCYLQSYATVASSVQLHFELDFYLQFVLVYFAQ